MPIAFSMLLRVLHAGICEGGQGSVGCPGYPLKPVVAATCLRLFLGFQVRSCWG